MNRKLILVTLLNTLCICLVSCETADERFARLFGPDSMREGIRQSANGNGNGNARIVGGETSPKHYPYMISLQMQSRGGGGGGFPFFFQSPRSNYSHFCGGSIYDENYIITAAHCVDGFNISRMAVFAGTNDLRKEDEGTRIHVKDCKIHPEYVELNNSDVAVCQLQQPFTFSERIQPITLSEEYIGGDETCLLTGWGYTTMIRGFPLPNELQRANLTSLTNQECNEGGHSVGPREICTLTHFGQGACGGDSGGPLVCKGALTGIVSYGTAVCALNVPDVYTRASEYVSWIRENARSRKTKTG